MYFCIKKYIGTQGEVCRHLKIISTLVVYATDRSKAVVPVLFLFCVALWFVLQSASCFIVSSCSLSSRFFIPLSIVISSLWEEGAGLCASRAFVCLFCTCYCLSFSSSWCRRLAAVCDCDTPWTFLLTLVLLPPVPLALWSRFTFWTHCVL